MSSPAYATPTVEELEEVLLACRYGEPITDLEEVVEFVRQFGAEALAAARDHRGNTVLHMSGGNGHLDITTYLLEQLPPTALIAPNAAQSTPLHWISLNYHLPILRLLCPLLPPSAFDLLNGRHKTAVQEAEEGCESWTVGEGNEDTDRGRERIRREEVVGYLLGCMGLGTDEGIKKEKEKRAKEQREREGEGEVAMGEKEGTELEEGVEGMKLVDEVTKLSTTEGAESTAVVDRLKEEMNR